MENPKQQVIDRIKTANNVLLTVSNNPSVDQLAAAIGLTLFLNKLGKHATTVFSGQVPPTLEFLQPEKTIEKTTDSLRDFIIALDKSKADKLRYKVEDKLVKIFITPYHTSIGEADLEFSHGDFNVDAVLALGVQKRDELDQAITAHGRILHDATVVTVNTTARTDIGAINWQDPNVSSLCELSYGVAEALQADAIDGQMATAFLTGIVAETERFSNSKTSSTAMAISSKLMTAGANQQLVATKLQPPKPQPRDEDAGDPNDESFKVPKGSAKENATKKPKENTIPAPPGAAAATKATELPKPVSDDGTLSIDHGHKPLTPSVDQILDSEDDEQDSVEEVHIDDQGTLKYATELAREQKDQHDKNTASQVTTDSGAAPPPVTAAPTHGGTLTANTQPEGNDPATDPLLSHSPTPDATPSLDATLQAASSGDNADNTLTDLEKSVNSPHLDQAREAVNRAAGASSPPQFNTDVYSAGLQPDAPTLPDSLPNDSPNNSVPADLPPNLVPPAAPIDTTASPTDATAPPMVPPPMMPPPPPPAPSADGQPPASAPGNPLFPQP